MKKVIYIFLQKFRVLLNDSFWRNVGNLFTGSFIGQALPILAYPILTRIYSKSVFDVYFVYSGIILLTQIISNLQYHYALLIPKEEHEAHALLFVNVFISFIVSLLLVGLIFLILPFLSVFVEDRALLSWIWFVPVSTLFLGLNETFVFYLTRLQKYTFITYGRISKGLLMVSGQVFFGSIGYAFDGLVWGLLMGQAVSVLLMFILVIRSDEKWFVFQRSEIKGLMVKYKDMPFFGTAISVISNLSNQLPVFMLTHYYGVGATADFGMANKIVNTPMGMISQSVGQVFHREVSEIMHTGRDLKRFVSHMYRNMFRVAIVPFSVVLLLAPWLFEWVLSDGYQSAGYMAQILVPFYFISFINNPITALLTMLNRQKWGTVYQAALLFARLIALGVGILFIDNVFITVGLFSIVGVVFNIVLYLYLKWLASNPKSKYAV